MESGKRGKSDMAQTDRVHKTRLLWKGAGNVALVVALGALLCTGGTLAYLNSQANVMLDEIQAQEAPKVTLACSYISYEGTDDAGKLPEGNLENYVKHSTLVAEDGVSTAFTPGSDENKFNTVSSFRIVKHKVATAEDGEGRTYKTGAITKLDGVNYDNMIVQVKNQGAPCFVRVWIGAPILNVVEDSNIRPLVNKRNEGSREVEFVDMYHSDPPFPEPGSVPSTDVEGHPASMNEDMIPFGFDGNYAYSGRNKAGTVDIYDNYIDRDSGSRLTASSYGRIVYHFAPNWEENWIYVGNSGYLDEKDTDQESWEDDITDVLNASEHSHSGGYFVYRHILGPNGVTAPLLTGISVSDEFFDDKGDTSAHIQLDLSCDALTALQDTLELAQENRYGWGSGRTRGKDYYKNSVNNRVVSRESMIQQFNENEVEYSNEAVDTPLSSATLKPWYNSDKDTWYLVRDALKPGSKKTQGLTYDEVLRADYNTIIPGSSSD